MKKYFVMLGLAMVIMLGIAVPAHAEIPTDAAVFNGHYYKVYGLSKTWMEAEAYCESMGGHLATITSAAEQTFVSALSGLRRGTNYWAGGTDEGSEGTWRWVNGEAWSYTNWAYGQPGNKQQRTNIAENYLQLCVDWGCAWNDSANKQDGTAWIGFICEWENGYTGEGLQPNTVPEVQMDNTIRTTTKEEIPGARPIPFFRPEPLTSNQILSL